MDSEKIWTTGAIDGIVAYALVKATIDYIADTHSQDEEERKAIVDRIHKDAAAHVKIVARQLHPSLADRLSSLL